jgi:putative aminopeptidase FrvX
MKMLQTLSDAVGVSGQEDAVRALVLRAIRPHVTDVRINALGGITALQRGTGERRLRVMLAAHMDEIGLMVTGFEGDGLIRFVAVGGIDDRILPGKRVRIGSTPGVIVWTPIHKNQDQNAVRISSLRIDIGATSKDEAAGKVKRGERIAFDSTFTELDGGRMLRGKAFDDRAGCALLIDVLQGGPYPVDVLAAFTVQEEIGLRGAHVAANTLQPDVALVLEGTTANDLPNPTAQADDEREINPTCRMGGGPVISLMDSSLIVPPQLVAFLRETAEAEGIRHQFKSNPGGGTDGGAIHMAGAGAPTAVISLPCRYIHSPAALLLRQDYDDTLRLVRAALARLTAEAVRVR